jgi:hypothetical protein
MLAVINFVQGINWALIMAVLFGISEALSLIPQVQSNGVFQMIFGVIKKLSGK